VVDEFLQALGELLAGGDLVVDGGASYWDDSIRRHARMKARGIHFAGLGTSGGTSGAVHGARFMLGGEGRRSRGSGRSSSASRSRPAAFTPGLQGPGIS
jgi:6-phosphogluconate dehydrogenase